MAIEEYNEAPLISVVIPIYNGAEKVKTCLQYLDEQTIVYPFEVLLIDDASPDGSGIKLVSQIQELKNNQRFRVILCKENGRAGAARNRGVAEARGEYIVFIDQDDYPSKDMLEVLYNLLENGKYDCSACNVVDKSGAEYKRFPCKQLTDLSLQKKEEIMSCFGYVFAIMIKKQILIENNLFFPEKVMFEDVLFTYGLLACINSINTTEKALYNRADDENSQTAFISKSKMVDRIKATELYLERYKENPAIIPYLPMINQFAFYYIFLSNTWWMMTQKELYDRNLLNECSIKGHALKIHWRDVFRTQSYFGINRIRILKVVYDHPWTTKIIIPAFHIIKPIFSIMKKIIKH